MKQIEFKSTIIEGFGSIREPVKFKMGSPGVTLVKGKTGYGKTTMFSAFIWCLFKVNLKGTVNEKVATWERLRNSEWQGTRVVVPFRIGDRCYAVARHLGYSGETYGYKGGDKLMIFSGDSFKFTKDDLVGTEQHKGDMEQYIIRLMGIDSKAFVNSILFGQRMKRLIEADNADKRDLFENLFDMDFVETAKSNAVKKLRGDGKDEVGLEKEILTLTNLINSEATAQEHFIESIETGKEVLEHFETDKQKRITEAEEEAAVIEGEIKTIKSVIKINAAAAKKLDEAVENNLLSEKKKADEEKETFQSQHKKIESGIKDYNDEINKCGNKTIQFKKDLASVKETCPTCGGPLNKGALDEVKVKIQNDIDKEEAAIKVLQTKRDKLLKEIKEKTIQVTASIEVSIHAAATLVLHQKSTEDFKKAKSLIEKKEVELNAKQQEHDKVLARLEKEKAVKPPEVNLDALRKQLEDSEQKTVDLVKQREEKTAEADRLNWWIKKGFGAGGLKSFVFNAMLTQLNMAVKKYGARMGIGVHFSVDLTKDSKPFVIKCYKGEHIADYKELSGGQKQQADVCIAFGLHDVVSMVSNFNVLILDEVCEGLDEELIEGVFDLIRVKAETGKEVFMITHNTMIDSRNCRTVTVEYENELSYIR